VISGRSAPVLGTPGVPGRVQFLSAWLRTFAVQGSWNYRTLVGAGLAYALAPLLVRIHAEDPAALRRSVERHAGKFNAHPYLTPVAVGALARLEQDGAEDDTIRRFRDGLQAPLGALGDQVVWAGWRPFCAFLSGLLFLLGLGPVLAAVLFLMVYNAGHLYVRVWGFRLGWREGFDVGAALKAIPADRISRGFAVANQGLIGAVAVLLLSRAPAVDAGAWLGVSAAAAGLVGYVAQGRTAGFAIAALVLACLV